MNEFASAALGVLGTIVVALIGLYGSKKLKIGTNQEKLVQVLKDLVEAQNKKIEDLEAQIQIDANRILALESKVRELTETTVGQATEILNLRRRGNRGVKPNDAS